MLEYNEFPNYLGQGLLVDVTERASELAGADILMFIQTTSNGPHTRKHSFST